MLGNKKQTSKVEVIINEKNNELASLENEVNPGIEAYNATKIFQKN